MTADPAPTNGQARGIHPSDLNVIGPPMVPVARKACRHCHGRGYTGTMLVGQRVQCRCVFLVGVNPLALQNVVQPHEMGPLKDE